LASRLAQSSDSLLLDRTKHGKHSAITYHT
jgi:hypothetical protein